MIDLTLRRSLADAPDSVPWQALSRAIERSVELPPGADATAAEPPRRPTFDLRARSSSLAIVVPHLLAGGGERTSVLLAKHLRRASRTVAVFNADPLGDARSFAPYLDDLQAAGVAYNSHGLREVAHYDGVLFWGRVVPPIRDGQRAVYFVNAPSWAAVEDLRFVRERVRIDKIVAASVGTARMAERLLEWPEGTAQVVWNGADEEELANVQPRPSDGRFVLGYLGRFSDEKNLLSAVAALKLLPPRVVARFVGEGPLPIERAARAWGVADRVEVLPPTGDRRGFYGSIDCFVLPSLYEATPTVVAEAMLAGVPVIASFAGDLPAYGGRWPNGQSTGLPVGPEDIAAGARLQLDRPIWAPPRGAACVFAHEHLTAERMATGYAAEIDR